MTRAIVLIGFSGSGKTETAAALARRLGFRAVDTDAMVEADAGLSIAEVFALEGEAGFRRREADAVAVAASEKRTVVACGGGAILSVRNYTTLRDAGTIVYLRAAVDTLIARLGDGRGRPLLGADPVATVPALLAERAPAYESAADLIVDTDGRTPDEVAAEIQRALGE